MDGKQPIIAICYDFDKTLSPKDMQEYGIIPSLKVRPEKFWKQSNELAKTNKMDKTLAYMHTIIDRANGKGVTFKNSDFTKHGESVKLFNGVETWFERINQYALDNGILVEHYIISAGIKEVIQGTSIANYFKEIFASSFHYDIYGKPIWPCQVVNYTQKTQYLFRISKNKTDLSDEYSVNENIMDIKRRIPFKNMIYIGDSDTDIPAMKVLKNQGGVSIGVYDPEKFNIDKVSSLLMDKRIDFFAPANYEENSILEKYIKKIIDKIKINNEIDFINQELTDIVENKQFFDSMHNMFMTGIKRNKNKDDKKQISKFYKSNMKQVLQSLKDKMEYIILSDFDKHYQKKKEEFNNKLNPPKKKKKK